jgi:hypothetical protein
MIARRYELRESGDVAIVAEPRNLGGNAGLNKQ